MKDTSLNAKDQSWLSDIAHGLDEIIERNASGVHILRNRQYKDNWGEVLPNGKGMWTVQCTSLSQYSFAVQFKYDPSKNVYIVPYVEPYEGKKPFKTLKKDRAFSKFEEQLKAVLFKALNYNPQQTL